ncbi:MAG: metallopeptidase family protein, partial [Geminicoccales bacterium]
MSRRPADQSLYAMPPSASDIERIGRKVLTELPDMFGRYVRDVVIRVQDFADDATLDEMGMESPFDLLGLYHGVPVGRGSEMAPPRSDVDIIFLYRRALLDYWCETGA